MAEKKYEDVLKINWVDNATGRKTEWITIVRETCGSIARYFRVEGAPGLSIIVGAKTEMEAVLKTIDDKVPMEMVEEGKITVIIEKAR